MTREVVTCSASDPADEVARGMCRYNVAMMPVLDAGGKLIGVISDRDLALRVLGERKSPQTPVEEVMQPENLIIIHASDNLETAENRLADSGKPRAVVVDDNDPTRLVGLIGMSDVAQAEDREQVGELLTRATKRRVAGRA